MFKSMTANLMTESVDDSVAFYQDYLGFSVAASVPGENGKFQFAILSKDGITLMFQERSNLTAEYPILAAEATRPSATLYITVDDLNETYEKLKSRRELLLDMHETFYGAKEFAVADNNGYVLTFTESRE